MADAYLRNRQTYSDMSGSLVLGTGVSGTQTLKSAKNANHTTFIQKIHVFITTSAAQSATFEDNNGTPVIAGVVPTSPTVNTSFTFDFGPVGLPLTQGKDFVLALSGAGLGASITWEAYEKLTGSVNVNSGAALQ